MKSQTEKQIEEDFTRKTGQTMDEHHLSTSRMLGRVVLFFVAAAWIAATYVLVKLVG